MAPTKRSRKKKTQKKRDTVTNDAVIGEAKRAPASGRKKKSKITILQIPADIVVEIFKYLLWGAYDPTTNWKYRNWNPLTFSHVCKHWRGIAIGTPVLWTRIAIGSGKCTKTDQVAEYLKRSGTSQIVVRYNGYKANDDAPRCLHLALKHLSRIRELHIKDLQRIPDQIISVLFGKPAPVLQKFTLDTILVKDLDAGTLFMGKAPKLTGLSICTKLSKWDRTPLLRDLERVYIGGNALSLPNIYSILSQNPNYQKFWIGLISKSTSINTSGRSQLPIELPFLKDIVVYDAEYEQLSELFRSIVAPKLSGWSIICKNYPIQCKSISPRSVMPFIPERRGILDLDIKISGWFITIDANPCYFMDPFDMYMNIFDDRDLSQKVTYTWEDEISIIQSFKFLMSVIEGSHWCSATGLLVDVEANSPFATDLYSEESLGGVHWKQLLLLFPDLETLTVRHSRHLHKLAYTEVVETESHHGVLSALKRTHSVSQEDGTKKSDLICPKLRSLDIYGIDINDDNSMNYLLGVLKCRGERGKRLSKLNIMNARDWDDSNLRKLYENQNVDSVEIEGKDGISVKVGTPRPLDDSEDEYDFGILPWMML